MHQFSIHRVAFFATLVAVALSLASAALAASRSHPDDRPGVRGAGVARTEPSHLAMPFSTGAYGAPAAIATDGLPLTD